MENMVRKTCNKCGGGMTLEFVSRTFCLKGIEIGIRGIRAYVCKNCGNTVYTEKYAKMIKKVISAAEESL